MTHYIMLTLSFRPYRNSSTIVLTWYSKVLPRNSLILDQKYMEAFLYVVPLSKKPKHGRLMQPCLKSHNTLWHTISEASPPCNCKHKCCIAQG